MCFYYIYLLLDTLELCLIILTFGINTQMKEPLLLCCEHEKGTCWAIA